MGCLYVALRAPPHGSGLSAALSPRSSPINRLYYVLCTAVVMYIINYSCNLGHRVIHRLGVARG